MTSARKTSALALAILTAGVAAAGDYEDAVYWKGQCSKKLAAVDAASTKADLCRQDAVDRKAEAMTAYGPKMGKMTPEQRAEFWSLYGEAEAELSECDDAICEAEFQSSAAAGYAAAGLDYWDAGNYLEAASAYGWATTYYGYAEDSYALAIAAADASTAASAAAIDLCAGIP